MIASFKRLLLSLGLMVAIMPTMVHGAPKKEVFVDGQNYVTLPSQLRDNSDIAQLLKQDPNKVQVLFFFSYGCPSCAKFDPDFEKWAKLQKNNSKVVIYRFPVSFHEEWEDLAKLYYVMKILSPKHSLDAKIFKAIHENNLQLTQEPIMQEFFMLNGFSAENFQKAYNSFTVELDIQRAEKISALYEINQLPTIVVNGPLNSYKLNRDKADNNNITLIKVLDYLIKKELNK